MTSALARPGSAVVALLVERYTANLLRAALGLGFDMVEAEELVQATFVAYLDGGGRFENRSKLLTYLFGILYNKARETQRLRRRTESLDAPVDERFESYFDSEAHWNAQQQTRVNEVEHHAQTREIQALLGECLEGLSVVMRMAFTLKEVEGLETDAICAVLMLTSSNLGVTLFRARNKLRDCLIMKGTVIV